MKIARRGTSADHGWAYVDLGSPSIRLVDGYLEISSGSVRDFSTRSNHNYVVTVSVEEFAKMIAAVGGSEALSDFREDLVGTVGHLLRIANTCTASSSQIRQD